MNEELKPCPFCGSSSAPKIYSANDADDEDNYPDQYQVVCDFNNGGCGSASGYRGTEEEAVVLWNTRR